MPSLTVRLMRREERRRWERAMSTQHYLGFRGIVGESLRYVATVAEEWVALLAWGAAALKVSSRDQWIGWDAATRRSRLRYVVNNVRFLLLGERRIPNLASRVLGANVRRLSDDWEQCYNHPILVAETFVDESRFTGTCYKAAGWVEVGRTLGFSRRRTGYVENGQPKKVFVRPLRREALQALTASFPSPHLLCGKGGRMGKQSAAILDVNRLPLEGDGSLLEALKRVTDCRKRRGIRHSLTTILAIAVCACLSGARSFTALGEWSEDLKKEQLRMFGSRRRRGPSESAIRRTLQRIDAAEVDKVVGKWLLEKRLLRGVPVGLDGKTLRGSHDHGEGAVHLLAAVLNEEGIVVAQTQVDNKTNEIPMVPKLLEGVDLRGAIVTADALHTQVNTVRYIVERKEADFVLVAKDNQPTLRNDIATLHMEAIPPSGNNGR
jgi:hypothetical protein